MCLFHGYDDEKGGERRVIVCSCSGREGEISIACSAKEVFRTSIQKVCSSIAQNSRDSIVLRALSSRISQELAKYPAYHRNMHARN